MWEWRVFIPSGSKSVDVWELLHCKPWSFFPDKRTDVYVVCSAGAGIKLRRQKLLEVKLRERRHEMGAELWNKVCILLRGFTDI